MTDKQIIKLNELTEISQELGLYEQCPYIGDDKMCKAHLNEVFWWKCYEFDNCLYKKYKAKEQECEELKEQIKKHNDDMFKNPPEKRFYCKGCTLPYISKKLKQTLTEIKPILEYYANSTLGEKQEDGTYRIELSYKYGSSNMYGAPCYYKYNPKPAKQALQKISEVEDETTK